MGQDGLRLKLGTIRFYDDLTVSGSVALDDGSSTDFITS